MKALHRSLIVTGLLALGVVVFLQPAACQQFERWFGPPEVTAQEQYTDEPAQERTVDHSILDRVLKAHVRDGGVDYKALHANREDLDQYVELLGGVDFDAVGRNEKLALLINAYNAFTLKLIIDNWPVKSIKDILDGEPWDAKLWKIGDLSLSLNDIEHEYIRKRFKEPRIHFAVNCASISCPPLRGEAYRADALDRQLQEQTELVHTQPLWMKLDKNSRVVELTRLYLWYGGDFEQAKGSVLEFAAQYNESLAELMRDGKPPTVEYLEYDWNLNIVK